MKILVLSDLHLGGPETDSRYEIFIDILKKFQSSSLPELILMGDIFDMLFGPYEFWKKIHPEFFNLISEIISKGKKIHWVQGNHDFQLGPLLTKLGVNWIENDTVLNFNGKRIFLSHGDLADTREKLHPFWRKILNSRGAAWALSCIKENFGQNTLYPFALKLSLASRRASLKRIKESDDCLQETAVIFRNYALQMARTNAASIVILGHSHQQENFTLENGIHYLNVGSWFEDQPVGIVEISDSGELNTKVCSARAWLTDSSSP